MSSEFWTENPGCSLRQVFPRALLGLSFSLQAFPPDFNVTILGKHVTVPMHALCTRMITIAFAKDFLWATADVAPPPAPAPEWPPELAHLTLPGAAAVYDQLVTSQGVPPDSMRGTAAGDWTSLRDRMRFVVCVD